MKWVVKMRVFGDEFSDFLPSVDNFMAKQSIILKTKGPLELISRIKAMRVAITSAIIQKDPVVKELPWISQYKNTGLPKIFGPSVNQRFILENRDRHAIRFILSLLQLGRIVPGWKTPDFRPIVIPAKINDSRLVEGLIDFIKGYDIPRSKYQP